MTKTTIRLIPNKELRRLNKIAAKHGRNRLTDDCPVLKDGYDVPIFLALPGIDSLGWVRCQIPATPDCTVQVFLDVRDVDFDRLPVREVAAPSEDRAS